MAERFTPLLGQSEDGALRIHDLSKRPRTLRIHRAHIMGCDGLRRCMTHQRS